MSLAATLSAGDGRPASFLPTVKCSNCGNEIEITALESHICGRGGAGPGVGAGRGHTPNMSNPFTLRRFNTGGAQPPNGPSPLQQNEPAFNQQFAAPRPLRTAPPMINPDAANRPFLATPASPIATPRSPAVRSESRNGNKPALLRSMTSPAPRGGLFDFRPPSPELSANLDCAFPPFPTAANTGRRPSTSQGRRTPNSERAPSRAASRLDQVRNAEPEPFDLALPTQKITGPQSVMQRMNSMKSGPFDGTQRKGSGDSKFGSPEKKLPDEPILDDVPSRLSSSSSNYSGRPSFPNMNSKAPPPRPERPMDGELSPRFLDSLSAEPSTMALSDEIASMSPFAERSNTFPLGGPPENESNTLTRMRSEPSMRDHDQRPPLPHANASAPATGPQIHTIPPRKDSRAGTRMDYRIQDAPPVPKAVEQYRQDSTHTPSESSSSTGSASHSAPTHGSNEFSPTSSVTSNEETLAALTFDVGKLSRDESIRAEDMQKPGRWAEQPAQKSPPRNFARPGPPKDMARRPSEPSALPMESPMDPALQQMQNAPGPTYEPWQPAPPARRPMPPRTQTATGPVPTGREPFPPALSIPRQPPPSDPMTRSAPPISRARTPSNASSLRSAGSAPGMRNPSPNALRPPPIPEEPQVRRPVRRGTVSKANCRGCGLMIEGKSVKAADGRLTGRWHKACFVCKSCQQPFASADFYVINNEPYCEQHYHEQNGSLCNGCHRGIEGQYIETSSSSRFGSTDSKYHPRCFTCWECRQVLNNDYFEIKGSVYCERHALAAMRAQARLGGGPGGPGGLNAPAQRGMMAERRTTRLINPIMAA